MMVAIGGTVVWMFGRGLSIGCGLAWGCPSKLESTAADEQIPRIKVALAKEMLSPSINASGIRDLLSHLENHTAPDWRHLFVTTNWDYLLQREISALGLKVQPPWLANSHVFHLNGTVENLPNNENRSPFPLFGRCGCPPKTDVDGNPHLFQQISWRQTFVVVGMSFGSTPPNPSCLTPSGGRAPPPQSGGSWKNPIPFPRFLGVFDLMLAPSCPH